MTKNEIKNEIKKLWREWMIENSKKWRKWVIKNSRNGQEMFWNLEYISSYCGNWRLI